MLIKNPFTLLNLSRYATKQEVLKRVSECMREKKIPLPEIAQAQKILFDEKQRLMAEFLCFLD